MNDFNAHVKRNFDACQRAYDKKSTEMSKSFDEWDPRNKLITAQLGEDLQAKKEKAEAFSVTLMNLFLISASIAAILIGLSSMIVVLK